MKTTLDIPDELMKEVKIRAVVESKKLNQLIPELLQIGLAQPTTSEASGRKRLELPLIPAKPRQKPFKITPQNLHYLELQDEMERHEASLR